ncbi:putative C-type lectin domain family 20 member A [Synchiropus picturatus]
MAKVVLLLSVLLFLLVMSSGLIKFQTVDQQLNWNDAQKHCRAKFADLATVVTSEEMEYFHVAPNNSEGQEEDAFWIGLYDDIDSWTWSIDGTYLENSGRDEFGNWTDNDGGDEHCAQLKNGTLDDCACDLLRNALCYDNSTETYLLSTELRNFEDAQTYCRQHSVDLASIKNSTELEEVVDIVGDNSSWWIGLSREAWKWSDHSTSPVPFWRSSQPGNEDGDEFCGFATSSGFDDSLCEEKRSFVCSVAPKKYVKLNFVYNSTSQDPLSKSFLLAAITENILVKLTNNGIYQHVRFTWK